MILKCVMQVAGQAPLSGQHRRVGKEVQWAFLKEMVSKRNRGDEEQWYLR